MLYTATLAKINYSLVLNLYSLCPFLIAIGFYLVFGERLTRFHGLGMAMMLTCVVITGESYKVKEGEDGPQNTLALLLPLALALLSALLITLSSIVSRYTVTHGGISSGQLMADSYMLKSIVVMVIYLCMDRPYSLATILSIGGVSFLSYLGVLLITEAVVHGKAGPSQALCEVQSPFLLALEILFIGKVPNYLQAIGFGVGVLGGLCIGWGGRNVRH